MELHSDSKLSPCELASPARTNNRHSFWWCHIPCILLLVLTSLGFVTDNDSFRARSIAARLYCDCGCHQSLTECSHQECTRKPVLIKQIAAGIYANQTDDSILSGMVAKYGNGILLEPVFGGFDALLWIMPAALAACAVVGFLIWWRKSRSATATPS